MADIAQVSEDISPPDNARGIRIAISSLLSRCGMAWPIAEYDCDFDAVCRADALRRGYPMEGPRSLAPFVHTGVIMATTAYAHLADKPTRVFISHYTASLMYIDELFQCDPDAMRGFNERFVTQQSCGDHVLDCFAQLLSELPRHFDEVVSNLVTPSTLNLITAMMLGHEAQGNQADAGWYGRPPFSRVLSGATETYALFAFPRELSLSTFVGAVPELMLYINYANDVLAFYDDERAGGSATPISPLVSPCRSSNFEALRHVTDAVVDSHNRVLEILHSQRKALYAYKNFISGYFCFHMVLPQYKTKHIGL